MTNTNYLPQTTDWYSTILSSLQPNETGAIVIPMIKLRPGEVN